jgi:hypothetical protein
MWVCGCEDVLMNGKIFGKYIRIWMFGVDVVVTERIEVDRCSTHPWGSNNAQASMTHDAGQ